MRRKVTVIEVGFDWICPLCDKPYGEKVKAYRIKLKRAGREQLGPIDYTVSHICSWCAKAIARRVEKETL